MAALSAVFAPDPQRPPFFSDLEVVRRGGQTQVDSSVLAKWNAHATLLMVPTYRSTLLRMRGIAFDIGTEDRTVQPAEMRAMDSAMTRAGIPHTFETYPGDHVNNIRDRLARRVLPFFTRTLVFQKSSGTE